MENKEIDQKIEFDIDWTFTMVEAFTTICRVLTWEQRERIALVLRNRAETLKENAKDEKMLNTGTFLDSFAQLALGEVDSVFHLMKGLSTLEKIKGQSATETPPKPE